MTVAQQVLARPRPPSATLHRGHVQAHGFVFLGTDGYRSEIIARWEPGCRVLEYAGAVVLLFATARWVRTETSPAAPLVRTHSNYEAVPMSNTERTALGAEESSVVWASAGVVHVQPLRAGRSVAVSEWIDLDGFALAHPVTLGAPPAPAVSVEPERVDSVRDALGGIVKGPAPADLEMRRALAGLQSHHGQSPPQGQPHGARDWLLGVTTWLRTLWNDLTAATPSPEQGSSPPAPMSGPPAAPGFFERARSAFRRALDQALLSSKLSRLLGARQAKYLSWTVDLFENDMMEALRHAIPLAGEGTQGDPSHHNWGLPSPRDGLALSGTQGGGSSYQFGMSVYQRLRETYRRAFRQLQAQGRIKEAAFVLAELLGQATEAVAFLEKHGQLREAAELADARDLPPALRIRQWILGKDIARAVAIARQHQSFAVAVKLLEQRAPAQAHALRIVWSRVLLAEEDLVGAAEVLWGVPEARTAAIAIAARGLAEGGRTSAALLPLAAADPSRWGEVRARFLQVLNDDSPNAPEFRHALAVHLKTFREQGNPHQVVMARGVLRQLVGDQAKRPDLEFGWLDRIAGDRPLWVDRPKRPANEASLPLAERTDCTTWTIRSDDRGLRSVLDLAVLHDGGLLVALGEEGVLHYRADGRLRRHHAQPAHQLVVADRGGRALALAKRGKATRIAGLDLRSGHSEHWADVGLEAHVATIQDGLWPVVERGSILMIDTLADRFASLSRVGDLGGEIKQLARGPSGSLFALVHEPESATLLRFDAHPLQLRERRDVPLTLRTMDPPVLNLTLSSGGSILALGRHPAGETTRPRWALEVRTAGNTRALGTEPWPACEHTQLLDVPGDQPGPPGSAWLATPRDVSEDLTVDLRPLSTTELRAQLCLEDSRDVVIRRTGRWLAVGDARGRAVVLDLVSGRRVLDIRT